MQTSRGKLPQPDSPEDEEVFNIIRDLLDKQIDAITYLERDDRSMNMGQDAKIIVSAIDEALTKLDSYYTNKFLEVLDSSVLAEVVDYYNSKRQVGHTTSMLIGASNTDCLVLVATALHGHNIENMGLNSPSKARPKWITPDFVKASKLRGYNKPLAIDHYALRILYSELRQAIKQLSKRGRKYE